jgi:hypothetical protein
LRDTSKRGSSAAQADSFAGANEEEKASTRFGRDDSLSMGGIDIVKIRRIRTDGWKRFCEDQTDEKLMDGVMLRRSREKLGAAD